MNYSSQSGEHGATKPKVVRIIARLNVGGPARQVCMLHDKLDGPFDTRLITGCLAPGEQDMSYLLVSEQHVYRMSQMSREVSFWSDVMAFWRIFRFLRLERPEIVHTHTAKAGALGRTAAWLARVPVIVHTYHGHVFHGYFGRLRTNVYLGVERVLGLLSTRIIAISESQREDLAVKYRVAPVGKIAVVYNGFELQRFSEASRGDARRALGVGPAEFVVAWAGRLVPVKDIQLLADVIRMAAKLKNKISFLIAGDGPERSRLESMVAGCGNTRLLGLRTDIETIWAASDAALLTSRNEGTPTALIEAMAAGLPFVSTCVGGVPDLAGAILRELPEGMGWEAANGFLTSRSAEAMLRCIQLLVEDPGAAKRKGAVGQAFSLKRFSLQHHVDEINLLYQDLLRWKRQARAADGRSESTFHRLGAEPDKLNED
ncbi:MAG TPA: glycosyltransferase [Verrucomicrobiae bacterium]|nr:glycosyltransferase [Verrucomicrobiae bacterium]